MASEDGKVPPSLDSLKKKWNGMSENYQSNYQIWAQPGLQLLFSNLALNEPPGSWEKETDRPKSILEVGVGPGGALARVLNQVPCGCEYTATDYAEEMVKLCRETLDGITPPGSAVNVVQAPASKLPFENGVFDRYVSNLCLMLIPDFDAGLREAARVLRPGAVMAFTLWGRRQRSHYFSIQSQAMKELGIVNNAGFDQPTRDNYHVLDQGVEATKARVRNAGFDRVVLFFTNLSHGHLDGKQYVKHRLATDQSGRTFREALPAAQLIALETLMVTKADELIAKGEPIGLDVAVIVCRRQMQL